MRRLLSYLRERGNRQAQARGRAGAEAGGAETAAVGATAAPRRPHPDRRGGAGRRRHRRGRGVVRDRPALGWVLAISASRRRRVWQCFSATRLSAACGGAALGPAEI